MHVYVDMIAFHDQVPYVQPQYYIFIMDNYNTRDYFGLAFYNFILVEIYTALSKSSTMLWFTNLFVIALIFTNIVTLSKPFLDEGGILRKINCSLLLSFT